MIERRKLKAVFWGVLFIGALLLLSLSFYFGESLTPPRGLFWGNFFLSYYGLLIALALVAAYLLALFLWPKEKELFDRLLLPLFIAGIIGGRIGFVLTEGAYFREHLNEIFWIRQGGMSIHGAILGGALLLWFWARRQKLSFLAWADRLSPLLALGQAIGRGGNFFNQEAFGEPTALPWKIFIDPLFRPAGFIDESFFHPLFLYEGLGNLFIFLFLLGLFGRTGHRGVILGWYLLLYSLLRFALEFIRLETKLWGVLTLAQWVSLFLVFLGLGLIIRKRGLEVRF